MIVKVFLSILLLVLTLHANVDNNNLWVRVGKIYNIDPKILYAIGRVESGINRYVVAMNATRLTQMQIHELKSFLNANGISYIADSKVFSIRNKNEYQAKRTVHFLYTRGYQKFDMGIMQINSVHKPMLDRAGISLYDLFEPRINIQVGAYVLATCMKRHPNSLKNAINAYNGKVDNNPYSQKVYVEYKKL